MSSFVEGLVGLNDSLGIKGQLAGRGVEVAREGGVKAVSPAQAPSAQAPASNGADPAAIEAAKAAQAAAAVRAAGNESTFLTSGMGLVDQASTEKKRLLGA